MVVKKAEMAEESGKVENKSGQNTSEKAADKTATGSTKPSSGSSRRSTTITFLGLSILLFLMFLATTEYLFDCSVMLNRKMLIITILVVILPIVCLVIKDKQMAKYTCYALLCLEILLLIYLTYYRNRVYIFYIQNDRSITEEDMYSLERYIGVPSAVVIFTGPGAKETIKSLSNYDKVFKQFIDRNKDPKYTIKIAEQLKTSKLEKRLSGFVENVVILYAVEFSEAKRKEKGVIKLGGN